MTAIRAIAVALALSAAPAEAQEFDPVAAVRAVAETPLLPDVLEIEVGNVSRAGSTVRLVDVRVELGARGAHVLAPTVLIDRLERDGEGFRAAAVRVPSAELQFPSSGQSAVPLGRIVIERPAFAAMAEPKPSGRIGTFEPLARWLTTVSADALTVGWLAPLPDLPDDGTLTDLRQDDALAPSPDVRLATGPIADGAVSRAALLWPQRYGWQTDPGVVTVRGLDLGAFADAFFGIEAERVVVLRELVVANLSNEVQGGTRIDRTDRLSIDNVVLSASAPSMAARIDRVVATDPAAVDERVALAEALQDGVRFGRIAVRGLSSETTAAATEPAEWSLGRVVAEMDEDGALSVALAGFESVEPNLVLSLDTARLVRLDLPDARAAHTAAVAMERADALEARAEAGEIPTEEASAAILPAMKAILAALPIVERVEITGLVGQAPGSPRVSVPSAHLTFAGWVGRVPTYIETGARVVVDDIEEAEGEFAAFVNSAGLDQIAFSFSDAMTWGEDGGVLSRRDFRVEDVIAMVSTFEFSGLDRRVIDRPERLPVLAATFAFDAGSVTVEDLGGVPALLRLVEVQEGLPFGAARNHILQGLAAALADTPLEPQLIVAPLEAFLDRGGTLTLSADPPRPLGFFQMGALALAPSAIWRTLGLELSQTDGAP